MIRQLTDGQLKELATLLNVTITPQNAQIIQAQLQLKLLRFEIEDELERRNEHSTE